MVTGYFLRFVPREMLPTSWDIALDDDRETYSRVLAFHKEMGRTDNVNFQAGENASFIHEWLYVLPFEFSQRPLEHETGCG